MTGTNSGRGKRVGTWTAGRAEKPGTIDALVIVIRFILQMGGSQVNVRPLRAAIEPIHIIDRFETPRAELCKPRRSERLLVLEQRNGLRPAQSGAMRRSIKLLRHCGIA